jgi:hypothetical protein
VDRNNSVIGTNGVGPEEAFTQVPGGEGERGAETEVGLDDSVGVKTGGCKKLNILQTSEYGGKLCFRLKECQRSSVGKGWD